MVCSCCISVLLRQAHRCTALLGQHNACACCLQGGDLRKALTEHSAELRWWLKGKRIAMDVARGLAYLHSQRVMHGKHLPVNVSNVRRSARTVSDSDAI